MLDQMRFSVNLGLLMCGLIMSYTGATGVNGAQSPLKVIVLAGQSNMEGQAEVSKKFANGTEMNGTLTYQLSDPRTAQEFAKCWDKTSNNWTVLPRVHVWFNEGKGEDLPTNVVSGGTHGPLSVGYGVGGSRAHIGPEYGFGFALSTQFPDEDFLIIKTAWGGKTLCGDFRPPSSCAGNSSRIGFYYNQMLSYVSQVLAPANFTKLFPDLASKYQTTHIVGFGWDQGWNDGCGVPCTQEYEQNMVNLIGDLRKTWRNPELAISIPVSGFDGWGQQNTRRLGIIDAQFGACNASRHPHMSNCTAEETRSFWRAAEYSPVPRQGYHWFHNAESYYLIGKAMAAGMFPAAFA